MLPQSWMVPSQKYDVIHYVREEFLKSLNPSQYVSVTPDYLAGLPPGASRGLAAASYEPWRMHDYGPFLAATIEVGRDGSNVARKGFAVRLDRGPGAWGDHAPGSSTTSIRCGPQRSSAATGLSTGRGSTSTAATARIPMPAEC